MKMEFQNKVDNIKEKVSRTSLYIGRVPDKTKTEFIELSKAEFAEDYGMCLKWLMDFRNGLLANPNQILSEKIDILAEQVRLLQEDKLKKEKDSGIKMVSGKKLKRRNENVETKPVTGQEPSI